VRNRVTALSLGLLAALPAEAQTSAEDFAALQRHAAEFSISLFVAGAARECGVRPAAWAEGIMRAYASRMDEVAKNLPGALAGGQRAAAAFLGGAMTSGELLGAAQARERSNGLCDLVRDGASLRYLDTLSAR
jgi:hypothetical protein